MKGFAFVLLCALVAVQGRHTGIEQSSRDVASLDGSPWVVHIRVAVATSGLLNSCVGSLIDNRWVLTVSSCVDDSRFIWLRYGLKNGNVINPSMVTESSTARHSADGNLALISIGRYVEKTDNISPVSLSRSISVGSATLSVFGALESGEPGEQLKNYEVAVSVDGDSLVVSSDEVETTPFDVGAPLVVGSAQIGVLIAPASGDNIGNFVSTIDYLDWIQEQTGIVIDPEDGPEATFEAFRFLN